MRSISAKVGRMSGQPWWATVMVSSGAWRCCWRTPVSMPSRLPRICTGGWMRAVFRPATASSCCSTLAKCCRKSGRTWSASWEKRWPAWYAEAVPPTSTACGQDALQSRGRGQHILPLRSRGVFGHDACGHSVAKSGGVGHKGRRHGGGRFARCRLAARGWLAGRGVGLPSLASGRGR